MPGDTGRKRTADAPDGGDFGAKRTRQDVGADGDRAPDTAPLTGPMEDDAMGTVGVPAPTLGLVTRAIPLKADEAKKPEALAAVQKELQNIMAKGVFDPTAV